MLPEAGPTAAADAGSAGGRRGPGERQRHGALVAPGAKSAGLGVEPPGLSTEAAADGSQGQILSVGISWK